MREFTPHPNPNCFPHNVNFLSHTQDNPEEVPNPQISASPPEQQLTPFISTFSCEPIDLQRTIKQIFHNILLQHLAFHNHKVILAHRKNRSLDSRLHTSKLPDQITTPLLKHSQHYKNRKCIQHPSYFSQTRSHLYPLHQSFTSSHALSVTKITSEKHKIPEFVPQHLYNIGQ